MPFNMAYFKRIEEEKKKAADELNNKIQIKNEIPKEEIVVTKSSRKFIL